MSNFTSKITSSEPTRKLGIKLWGYKRQFCVNISSVFISSQKTNQALNAKKKVENKPETITLLYELIIYLHLE